MATIEKSIEVNVPVETAYTQWMQFEEFPRFMDGVKEVTKIDDDHLHWKVEIAGMEKEWDTQFIEQTLDRRIAWTSPSGAINSETVTFHRLSPDKSKIELQVAYDPASIIKH